MDMCIAVCKHTTRRPLTALQSFLQKLKLKLSKIVDFIVGFFRKCKQTSDNTSFTKLPNEVIITKIAKNVFKVKQEKIKATE